MEIEHVETIILGAGFAGISCAYQLQKFNKQVLLIERDHVGGNIYSSRGVDFGTVLLYNWYYNVLQIVNELEFQLTPISVDQYLLIDDVEYDVPSFTYSPMNLLYINNALTRNFYLQSYSRCRLSKKTISDYLIKTKKVDTLLRGYTYFDSSKCLIDLFIPVFLRSMYGNKNYILEGGLQQLVDKMASNITLEIGHAKVNGKTITINGKVFTFTNLVYAFDPFDDDACYTHCLSVLVKCKIKLKSYGVYLINDKTPLKCISYLQDPSLKMFYFEKELLDDEIMDIIDKYASDVEIIEKRYFKNAMPYMTPFNIKSFIALQGVNDIYYCGQYLGYSSLEMACYTGRRVAHLINGSVKSFDKQNRKWDNIYFNDLLIKLILSGVCLIIIILVIVVFIINS